MKSNDSGHIGVALVIVTLGSDRETLRLLSEAANAGYDSAVVVDCGNTSQISARAPGPAVMEVSVLRPGQNIGYGPGCNLGASHAIRQGASVLVFANPDLECDRDTLHAMAHRCRPGEIVAPVLNRPDGRVFRGGRLDPWNGATAARPGDNIAWVSSALIAVAATDWESAEGFDPRFFIYWDDVDLCTRLIRRGCRLVVDEAIAVTHIGRGSHRGRRGDHFYSYLNCRNRLLYAHKHIGSRPALSRWLFGSLVYVLRVSDLGRSGRAGRLFACVAGTIVGIADLAGRAKWGAPPGILLLREGQRR